MINRATSAKVALIAVLAGSTLGYSVGRVRTAHQASQALAQAEAAAMALRQTTERSSGVGGESGGGVQQFKRILSSSTDREALLWLRSRWGTFRSRDYKAATSDLLAVGIGRHGATFNELLECWGRIAPQEALAYIETSLPHQRTRALQHIIKGWALEAPDALLAWYREQKAPTDVERNAVVRSLATTRPDAIFENFIAPKSGASIAQAHDLAGIFLRSLAQEQPARAVQYFNRLPAATQRAAIGSLVSGWGESEAALAWLSTFPKGPLRENGFASIVHLLSGTSPREAAQMALRELAGSEHLHSAAYAVINQWIYTEPEEAARFFDEAPDSPFKKRALEVIDSEMARTDPLDLLNRSLFAPEARNNGAFWTAAGNLFEKDRGAFEEWFRTNSAEIHPDMLTAILWAPSSKDPELTIKLLALLPEGSHVDSAYTNVGAKWAQTDMEAARRFLATLPEGTARDHFQIGLLATLATSDLPTALREAGRITDPQLQLILISNLSIHTQVVAGVAAWVQSLPQNEATDRFYETITRSWSYYNPNGVAAWIEQLPEGAGRQQSIRTYIMQITHAEPHKAITWAEKIRDPQQREDAILSIANSWWHADRAAASEWIATSPLPENIKQHYLKQ